MGLENEDFSDDDQYQCMYTWEFFAYISSVSTHPENFHQSNSPLVNSPCKISTQKIPTWNIPIYVFKYSHRSLLFFFIFFHYCHHYHWYYLKDCFVILCLKSAEVFTFVKICQNKVLSEERQLMKWVPIFQVRIFLVVTFRVEFSTGEFDEWKFFGWKFPRITYLFLFFKRLSTNTIRLSIKRCRF